METLLTDDYETTAYLCKKRIWEAGRIYLNRCNGRWTDAHIRMLNAFHKRICACIKPLTKTLFEQLDRNEVTYQQAENYMKIMQGKCFGMLLPTIDIFQEMTSVNEASMLYDTFAWMEQLESMRVFLERSGNNLEADFKLQELLSERNQEEPQNPVT